MVMLPAGPLIRKVIVIYPEANSRSSIEKMYKVPSSEGLLYQNLRVLVFRTPICHHAVE